MKVSELTGPELDHWVAKAVGWRSVTRKRTFLRHVEDGWGRSAPTVPPVWDTETRTEWFLPSKVDAAIADPAIIGATSPPAYSREWLYGGPIIEQERIKVFPQHDRTWAAQTPLRRVESEKDAPCWGGYGETPLIAAMRAYVASKFGEEVPDSHL